MKGHEGLWIPFPVEYKRGVSKQNDADRLQLCCQGMCLEEMLCVDVMDGALYYAETRRRENVRFTEDLRDQVRNCLKEMHELYRRGYTPKVKRSKTCNACSLKDLCLPGMMRCVAVSQYIDAALKERS